MAGLFVWKTGAASGPEAGGRSRAGGMATTAFMVPARMSGLAITALPGFTMVGGGRSDFEVSRRLRPWQMPDDGIGLAVYAAWVTSSGYQMVGISIQAVDVIAKARDA